ncbi:uncharacterized protein LOC131516109 isoform X2 [Neofelis nebulosa]|uniref:uncharacterized protein LOC131516109 isoform X2 n=1 Tax=Neofelis nebulosa TaxID=61452 RepID=UPI00272B1954|nr:uncharacterized protein LOC131516109 isoform X2 [Neofelis nebulosa]
MAPRDRRRGSWKGGHEELPWPGFQGAGKAPAFAKKLSSPSRRFLPSLKYTPAHHERFLPWVKGRPLSNYHFLVAKTHVTLPAICPLLRVVRTSSGTFQETVTRSHDMSLQLEAFQGGPKRPPGSSVTCGQRKRKIGPQLKEGGKKTQRGGTIQYPTGLSWKRQEASRSDAITWSPGGGFSPAEVTQPLHPLLS